MDVIGVPREITFVAQRVLPIAPLPDAALALATATRRDSLAVRRLRAMGFASLYPSYQLLPHRFELVNPSPAVFDDVEIVPGIQRHAVCLIEQPRQISDPAQARHDLARAPLDDIDL